MYKIENIRFVSAQRNDVYIYEINFSINKLDINFTTVSVFFSLLRSKIEKML